MAGPKPNGSDAFSTQPRTRLRVSRFGTLLVVVALAACTASPGTTPPDATPSAIPASPVPSATAPGGSPIATPGATAAPTGAPATTPPDPTAPAVDPTGWSELALAPAVAVGAELSPVRGSGATMSPRDGVRVAATGDVPVAALVARLRVEPPFDYAVITAADNRSAVLRPVAALTAGARHRFTLLDDEGAPLTAWAFEVGGPLRVVGTLPADATTDVPATTGIEVTFDRDGVALDPADVVVRRMTDGTTVAGRLERHGRSIAFVPAAKLRAGNVYQVTLRAGAGAAEGFPGLPQAVAFSFRVASAPKIGSRHATFEDAFVTASPGERALFRVTAWRARPEGETDGFQTPVRLRVYRLENEAAGLAALGRLLGGPTWFGAEGRPTIDTAGLPVAFAGMAPFAKNGWDARLRVPVTLKRGWYLVELRETDVNQAVLQVTEVAAMAGARDDRVVVWANSTATGRAIGDASVAVIGGPSLGRTDATGMLTAATPDAVASPAGPVFLRVTAPNGRRAVIWLGDRASPKGYGDWLEPWSSGPARWWSALATDRWLYRATDTVEVWGYLRSRTGALPSTIELRLWRGYGDDDRIGPLATATARRAPTGAFAAQIALADLPYGGYVLESVADGQSVERVQLEVGDLRKPAYELVVAAAPRAVISGARVKAMVVARFFDGTPVARLPLGVSSWVDVRGNDVVHRVTTNSAGKATTTFTTRLNKNDGQESCTSVEARPEGAEEAEISAYREICVYRAAVYVDVEAVRDGGAIVVKGSVHEVDLAAVAKQLARNDRTDAWGIDPRGDPVAGRAVRIAITEQVLRRVVTSRWYDPLSKQVVEESETEVARESTTTRTVTTRSDGTFRLRFAAREKDRSWGIEARVRDAAGRTTSTSTGVEGPADAQAPLIYNLHLKSDDQAYSVGDTVTAEVTAWRDGRSRLAPSGAANRYLFLIASAGRLQPVVRTSPVVRTTFRASDEPNLRVTAVWFTGSGYVVLGDASAVVDEADRKLTVKLATDRERYRPGDRATISVRTTDPAGRPVSATVLLRGVDEKIVSMGAAGLADPLEMLYRTIAVGLAEGPAVTHAVWVPQCEGGGSTRGGGGEGGGRDDLADALPVTMVTTGADGTTRVEIRLPEDVTSWRVGAAAMTADRRAGQAAIRVPVGLPFFVEATIAPEYLVGDVVAIRVRAFGSALGDGTPVSFRVSSKTLAMPEVAVAGRAFTEALVPLPKLTEGSHTVSITATSAAGRDTLVRRFTVVASRLRAARRETVAIDGPTEVAGGDGLTRVVLTDAGRARYLDELVGLAVPGGQRSDEQLAAAVARDVLAAAFDLEPGDLPPAPAFERSAYQREDGGLALLPYGSSDLELTVRALVADRDALLGAVLQPWLRGIADDTDPALERRAVALAGLAALGDPVLGELAQIAGRPDAGGRTRLWAALGLALLGDTGRAAAIERSVLQRWGERRGDLVRLRISGDAEEVSEATDLAALVAAVVDDPLAADLLAYVVAVPPRDTLTSLTEATVLARLVDRLEAAPAIVALVRDGRRTTLEIPAGGSVTLEVPASQRAGTRIEPVSGAASMTALWEVRPTLDAALGERDPDLALQRTFSPRQPIAANRLVTVRLRLDVRGPGRDGETEVVELVPSGLVAMGAAPVEADECSQPYRVAPSRIEGQRVTFVVSYSAPSRNPDEVREDGPPAVPGRFCLDYVARVVTAGTYAWEPAVARQAVSPTRVAVTAATTVELR
jgi:hypothetical protein